MLPINYVAVVAAAIVCFIIGFLFHGPVFGKLWMKLAKIVPTGNEKFKDMIPQMVKNMIMNLICAYVLAVFITIAGKSITNGICIAILVWFGFIVTGSSMDVIWMGKSKKLWLFEIISSLTCLVAMGALIGVM